MSNRIREVRQAKGLKQRELAEVAHVCQTIVSDLEREVRRPWLMVANRLSQALEVSIEELFPDDFKK